MGDLYLSLFVLKRIWISNLSFRGERSEQKVIVSEGTFSIPLPKMSK